MLIMMMIKDDGGGDHDDGVLCILTDHVRASATVANNLESTKSYLAEIHCGESSTLLAIPCAGIPCAGSLISFHVGGGLKAGENPHHGIGRISQPHQRLPTR